ncbi:MAG: DNA replication protein DnaD [Firmicutes bacterium]|nr:DNA replication protein DnaD [Bacillota bacterium]MBT9157434.1 DNA replication protein DnaD [Bacillota bacterium]
MAKHRIKIEKREGRREFSIIFHELWTVYLSNIGGSGALLYCFLKYLAVDEVPHPCSVEWEQEVCLPLGLSYEESHAAWARLQEYGLILLEENSYVLCEPQGKVGVAGAQQGDSLLVAVEALFGRPLSMTEVHLLGDLCKLYDEALVRAAVQVAAETRALSLPYIRQVLLNWKAKGILTAAEADADRVAFQEGKAKRNHKSAGSKREKAPSSPLVPTARPKYDEAEIIMRRIKKTSGDEVGHGR